MIHCENVSYGKINPSETQEIFIREGLVTNQLNDNYGFIQHNSRVVREIEKLEDKLRTSLAMIDDELYEFYQDKLPPEVLDVPSLEQFIKTSDAALRINQQEFVSKLTSSAQQLNLYPDYLTVNEQKIRLQYVFDHHSSEDGVIANIELHQLPLVDSEIFSWLVAGMIRDKIAYLIKTLPKNQRLQFNPLQESITQFLEYADNQGNLLQQFISFAKSEKQLTLNYADLRKIEFQLALRVHFRIIERHKVIAGGDDLEQLKTELSPRLSKIIVKHSLDTQIRNINDYIPEFSQLLNEVKLGSGGKLTGYYSLIVEADKTVTFGVVSELAKARKSTYSGWAQLIKLRLKDLQKYYETKKISGFNEISLAFRIEYNSEQLNLAVVAYIFRVTLNSVLGDKLALSHEDFLALVAQARKDLAGFEAEIAKVLLNCARLYGQIKKTLEHHKLAENILLQLDDLIFPDFLSYVKWEFLQHYPRYLQAILIRLEKYANNPNLDRLVEHGCS